LTQNDIRIKGDLISRY